MSTNLTTHWSEHDTAVQTILQSISVSFSVFDEDLARLRLERPENVELLRSFLAGGLRNLVRIVLKNAEPFRRDSPRLFRLLSIYPHQMYVVQCPEHLRSLNDSMLIANDSSALVRFHKDNARSRVIINDREACTPYIQRFNDITGEGGDVISATTLGL